MSNEATGRRRAQAPRCILVLNAGSSSIKFGLFDADDGVQPFLNGIVEGIGTSAVRCAFHCGDEERCPTLSPIEGRSHESTLQWLLPELQARAQASVIAVGHRIVHGGADYSRGIILDDEVLAALEKLIPLARTHQPHNLAAVRAVRSVWPGTPQVGSFDTAFHATIPDSHRCYALPAWLTAKGVRRYGFHGLSYQWIAWRLADYLGTRSAGRVIVAHLGNGSSLCGMVAGESRATSMGFTPLDGLVMGERAGSLDPGVVLFLFEEMKLSAAEVRDLLFKQSGLKGVSGLSNDMRVLLASSEPSARLALDLYVHRAVREVGATAADIGGVDALVFTGGIGENSSAIRARIVEGCEWLGAKIDPDRNLTNRGEISPEGNRVRVYVVPTNEEAVIVAETRACLRAMAELRSVVQ